MPPTVLSVVGARPQFIKAAPVSRALAAEGIHEVMVHTGQHYDPEMSGRFFDELQLRQPDVNLGVGSGSHALQTSRMIAALEAPMLAHRPDWVLVYGDTNSTLAAAVVASKIGIPIAHVEAGLRSFNRSMPEEINRIVTDSISTLHFAPTVSARDNLAHEGVPSERIHLVGDVMLDAALQFRPMLEPANGSIANLPVNCKEYALATIHRAENTDDPGRLHCLLDSLNAIAADRPVVFPVHPRTRSLIRGDWKPARRLVLTAALGYLQTMQLTANAGLVLTDSGGLQKEAFFHRVPCVLFRSETEWVELVAMGWNRLAPPVSVDSVVAAARAAWGSEGIEGAPFGDGAASAKIARALRDTAFSASA